MNTFDKIKSGGFRFSAFSFSAASLLCFPFWHDLYTRNGTPFDDKFLSNHHQLPLLVRLDYIASILVALAVVVMLFLAFHIADRCRKGSTIWLMDLLALGLALYMLNVMRVWYLHWMSFGVVLDWLILSPLVGGVAVTVGAVGLCGALWLLRPVLRRLVLLGIPIGVVTLVNAVIGAVMLGGTSLAVSSNDWPLAARHVGDMAKRRVVWVIFDETDYRLTFEKRPAALKMPNFDRLRGESFFAEQAFPPHHSTLLSMSSVITGKRTYQAAITAAGPMLRWNSEKKLEPWRNTPSLFADVHAAGGDIGILGHPFPPYCRIFHAVITTCWEQGESWLAQDGNALTRTKTVILNLLAYVPLVNRLLHPDRFQADAFADRYLAMGDGIRTAVTDPGLELVLVHWNIPGDLYLYDHIRQAHTMANEETKNYVGNLALVDRLLGNVLDAIKVSPARARTTLIVSSDHHWPQSLDYDGIVDKRVPFIVRFPGQSDGVAFTQRLATILTTGIVRDILDGKVDSPAALATLLRDKALYPNVPPHK